MKSTVSSFSAINEAVGIKVAQISAASVILNDRINISTMTLTQVYVKQLQDLL